MSAGFSLERTAKRVLRKLAAPARNEMFRSAVSSLHRDFTPIRPEALRSTLKDLIGEPVETLFVHSSLSSCGRLTAGPEDVLEFLGECCTTLCLPTHTYCYPSAPGEAGPVFDPAATPSQSGLLTEIFRSLPGVLRSVHATHSLAARGPAAAEICADHYRQDSPCGSGTPYSRLAQRRASVLMFGVTFHSYTLFHTAEFESGSEYAFEHGTLDRLRVVDERGEQRDCWSRRQSWAPYRFEEAGSLLERLGLARRVKLGRSFLFFVPDALSVHNLILERLKSTPDILRQCCRERLE